MDVMPSISCSVVGVAESNAATSTPDGASSSTPSVEVKRSRHVRSHSDTTGLNQRLQLPIIHNTTGVQILSETKKEGKPRFLEDGGSSIVLPAGGHEYPKRQRGQSLVEYLMTNHANMSACAELDRENAHFSVSEAMIAAIEEAKFSEWVAWLEDRNDDRLMAEDVDAESDEEVRRLTMELRDQRLPRCRTSARPIYGAQADVSVSTAASPESAVTSVSPPASLCGSSLASAPADSGVSFASLCSEVERQRRRSRKMARLRRCRSRWAASNQPQSAASSLASTDEFAPASRSTTPTDQWTLPTAARTSRRALFSPTPTPAATPTPAMSEPTADRLLSAENIALTLLGHFSQLRLPHETELQWLVSEKDAPQHMLPMPQSWPVNPDDPFMQLRESESDASLLLRGNDEWAPPRPQIVFAVYSSPNFKVVMAKQNYRCAGCGLKVEPEHSRSFRYCHYLGRYFCTACHTNRTAVIPSRIFKKWDFRKYTVSNFSHDLLERMWFDPLFRLSYINPLLYRRCRQLNKVLELRMQLIHVAEFLRHCRYAEDLWNDFRKEAADWLDDAEIYSLHDLARVNSGELQPLLRAVVTHGIKHVIDCELCKARGFLCEMCGSSEVIFPFQLDAVVRCERCGSCFHRPCWSTPAAGSDPCPRCQRIDRRSTPNTSSKN